MGRVTNKGVVVLGLLLLAGCMNSEERLAANNAKDDQACLSYGAKPGTDAYVNCRAQLEGSRRQADAAADEARSVARDEAREEARRQARRAAQR